MIKIFSAKLVILSLWVFLSVGDEARGDLLLTLEGSTGIFTMSGSTNVTFPLTWTFEGLPNSNLGKEAAQSILAAVDVSGTGSITDFTLETNPSPPPGSIAFVLTGTGMVTLTGNGAPIDLMGDPYTWNNNAIDELEGMGLANGGAGTTVAVGLSVITVQAVMPEPSTVLPLGILLSFAAGIRRRRKNVARNPTNS